MVGILKRMHRLKELFDVRLGPGAMIIKPEVKRIHLHFAKRTNDGHVGPRKFQRDMLPRLKYHNPAVNITVDRNDEPSGSASLYVYLARANATSNNTARSQERPPAEPSQEQEMVIDMKHKTDAQILEEFTALVDGQQVEATEQEKEEMAMLAESRGRAERDAVLQAEVLAKKRREQEVLEQARRSAQMQAG